MRHQELTLERERWGPIPDLVVRAGAGNDPPTSENTGYSRIYLEPSLWDCNQSNIHTPRNGLTELQRDVCRVRLNQQQRLARDFNHLGTSLARVRGSRGEILPQARRAFALHLKSFREEDSSYSRVQTSQSACAQALIKYVEQQLELRRAEVAIEGLELVEETVECGTIRPPGSGRLSPPGQGIGRAPASGGVPVGRPSRSESP